MKPKRILIALAASALSTSLALAAANTTPSSAGAPQNQQVISADRLSQSEIRQVQESLNAAGHMAGPVDGIWGPQTEGALRSFQESRGIEATGRLDQDSALALGFSSADFAALETDEAPRLSEADVRQVQEQLNAAGYTAGPVDGIWGPMTEDALRQFQEARGIEATGQLNQESVLALGLPISDFAAGEFQERTDDPQ